jgi:hypothetical protein
MKNHCPSNFLAFAHLKHAFQTWINTRNGITTEMNAQNPVHPVHPCFHSSDRRPSAKPPLSIKRRRFLFLSVTIAIVQ